MPLDESHVPPRMARRSFLSLAAAVPALAQTQTRDWTNQQTTRYPDPDIVALDKSFAKYQLFNAVIYRHYTGTKWAEGPAWCAQTQTRHWTNQQTTRYPDPDIVALDKSFAKYQLFNAVIYRHYTGTKWAEGPAWCAQGQYLL